MNMGPAARGAFTIETVDRVHSIKKLCPHIRTLRLVVNSPFLDFPRERKYDLCEAVELFLLHTTNVSTLFLDIPWTAPRRSIRALLSVTSLRTLALRTGPRWGVADSVLPTVDLHRIQAMACSRLEMLTHFPSLKAVMLISVDWPRRVHVPCPWMSTAEELDIFDEVGVVLAYVARQLGEVRSSAFSEPV